MNKIILLAFVFILNFVNSQIVFENSLDLAFEKAKKENKIVMIKYYSNTCSHCIALQKSFELESVYTEFNKNFVVYKMDIENLKEEDDNFVKSQGLFIENVPYLLFYDTNKKFIHYAQPKQDEASVIKVAKIALIETERSTYLPTRYESGDRDVVMLKFYSKYAQLQKKDKLVDQLANDIYDNFDKSQLISVNSIVSTAKYVKSINNGFFAFWMDNYSKLETEVLEFTLEEKQKVFTDILSASINREKSTWNLEEIQRAKRYIQITQLALNENSYTWQEESNLLFKEKKEKEVLEIGKSLMSDANFDFYMKLYVMKQFIPNFKEKSSFIEVESWINKLMQQRVEKSEIGKLKCYLVLLYKQSNLKDYKTQLNETEQYLKENKLNVELINDILNK